MKPHPVDNPESQGIAHADSGGWLRRSFSPFRKATLQGLAVILPPLLTVVLFIWAWGVIDTYVLRPVDAVLRQAVVWSIQDIRDNQQISDLQKTDPVAKMSDQDGRRILITSQATYAQTPGGRWIPTSVKDLVDATPGEPIPKTATEYYQRYVQIRLLKRYLVLPALLALFLALLYLLGKLLAANVGRLLWRYFESLVNKLPIIRNVYSSVKQVTDFAFSENEFQFTRVVAVEYPRRGIWSMGFVTGESFLDIRNAADEPVLSVLMPTSPMPATGFTISVRKSETIDLNLTIDQAIQFCVSCGVVVPEHQQNKSTVEGEVRRRFSSIANSQSSNGSPETDSASSTPAESASEISDS